MSLRCLLFTSEEGTAAPIRQALSSLGVNGEHCPEALGAVDKVTQESFQIVIIDWDQQPEAGMVLAAARERKASDRPLTLAIVGDDTEVPKALQAGVNSVLRRPILINQVKDTLITARDLLKAKESGALNASSPVVSNSAHGSSSNDDEPGDRKNLRAGEFLPSSAPRPSGEFVVEESKIPEFGDPVTDIVDPLKELEPMAASVSREKTIAPPLPPPSAPTIPQLPTDEPHGLEWYLKKAGLGAAAPARARASGPPELLGFDQIPLQSSHDQSSEEQPANGQARAREKEAEESLFAYLDGDSSKTEKESQRHITLGKGAIIGALGLAVCAVIAAPQAPWHGKLLSAWGQGQRSLHAWLNPQPVITPQAPESHESFARAGDEYKLPVAETIPDATTDPSQIKVVPVIDPTAKKPNNAGGMNDLRVQPETPSQATADPAAKEAPQRPTETPGQAPPDAAASSQPDAGTPNSAPSSPVNTESPPRPTVPAPDRANPATVPSSLLSPRPADPGGPRIQMPQAGPNATVNASSRVPSSLKSQIASMTPEMSGNKAPEAALPSIEPVVVAEAAERLLVTEQPAITYPASARGQQGTVTLQVVIGRDGIVQDVKLLQGSLAFARTAIDGVRQWKFKPYSMNGRPVSVQTTLTMSFKPAS